MIEWIGYAAAFFTTVCYVPQAVHVIVTRHTQSISSLTYCMLFLGISLWLIYGLLKGDWPIVAANGVSLPLVIIILLMKLRHG
jgi:MtN3 and saliva related transmembrane protein